jgi:hypothetical protein
MEQFLFIRKWENTEHYYDNIADYNFYFFKKKEEEEEERMCT